VNEKADKFSEQIGDVWFDHLTGRDPYQEIFNAGNEAPGTDDVRAVWYRPTEC
jgi:hypothetical protein